MKTKFLLFTTIVVLLSAMNAAAQDIITQKDGTTIEASVSHVGKTAVIYTLFGTTAPTYNVPRSSIYMIKFENGNEVVLEDLDPEDIIVIKPKVAPVVEWKGTTVVKPKETAVVSAKVATAVEPKVSTIIEPKVATVVEPRVTPVVEPRVTPVVEQPLKRYQFGLDLDWGLMQVAGEGAILGGGIGLRLLHNLNNHFGWNILKGRTAITSDEGVKIITLQLMTGIRWMFDSRNYIAFSVGLGQISVTPDFENYLNVSGAAFEFGVGTHLTDNFFWEAFISWNETSGNPFLFYGLKLSFDF